MSQHPFDLFGIHQFSDTTMEKRLPRPIFSKFKHAIAKEEPLDRTTADSIAHEMKIWALEHGCTHFSHWFQPLTGQTAEKHDSFLDRDGLGHPIATFSGKSLIRGDTDGSSFPSGGLRATFEARGYTYWDITSPAFIRDNVLCIPTVFVSYTGEHLDLKGPLLKALDACSREATRVVKVLGDSSATHVKMVSGLEQEYFLIDHDMFLERKDLLLTGRTLLGASAPRGQEFEDHYFGSIVERVKKYMDDVNLDLWKLGIYAKVEHNEVAPGQYEISPVFSDANIAVDQNQLTMDVLKKAARRHGMECLLHEKPFAGINGSGKHNNWSLITSSGHNLFEPGDDPAANVRFLLFVAATVKAIDMYPELIRLGASGPGNDHRLGANEAPPAIVSVYLGDVVEEIFLKIIDQVPSKSVKGNGKFNPISGLAYLPKENSDRNRTSPFAFTGNKFELRMLGSSLSAATVDTAIAAMLADVLGPIADRLEKSSDASLEAMKIIEEILVKHHRVMFSGDGYSAAWVEEAARRGLPNITSFVEAIGSLVSDKSVALFGKLGLYSRHELEARSEVLYEQYKKTIAAEARTLIDMVERYIFPSISLALTEVLPVKDHPVFGKKFDTLSQLTETLDHALEELKEAFKEALHHSEAKESGFAMREKVVPLLRKVRAVVDDIEVKMPAHLYPFPTYVDILFMRD